MNTQNAPLTAVIVGMGCAENSSSTLFHAMAVHNRKAFHAVRINTSHSSRVTRKGGLLILRRWQSVSRTLAPLRQCGVANLTHIYRKGQNIQRWKLLLKQNQAAGESDALFGMMSKLKVWSMLID